MPGSKGAYVTAHRWFQAEGPASIANQGFGWQRRFVRIFHLTVKKLSMEIPLPIPPTNP
jgi:hypothetical protein